MSSNKRIGKTFVNKYGLLEVKRGSAKNRLRLTCIDKLDKVWLANTHGALVPDESTTHVRIICDRVEPHGCWVITSGSDIVDINNSYAGERFDEIIPLIEGAVITTTLHGMQRENAAEVWIQELIIDDNDGN